MTSTTLKKGLGTRHIRFMALGSAIGTGLFYGSADAIKIAGPAVLLAYVIGGIAAYIIMRALGEMSVNNPQASSFSHYAQDYLGPLSGYITGWTANSQTKCNKVIHRSVTDKIAVLTLSETLLHEGKIFDSA
ncbi:hypothetical protein BBW68_01210 [Candidatus Erwinia dacicola]|uniref:Aromatic amino acid transport protein AroP n=1 Tax=Candidatus Erwinia dacicola TaxID=252393 RepID=A0A1E7Z352_9GAMM|nr:hypothetical protein BBW68_01210 [Candidatus Erwinia dacicola]RAP70344.1 amino acid permease family protein [Candidatus Erwinia dacicola]